MALPLTLIVITGEIDLSVGSVAGLSAAVLGVTLVNDGWPWWLGIIVMLVIGAAIGAFQGAWVALVGVPSFVVTLAGLLGWLGVQLHVLGDAGTLNVFEPHISAIATTFLPDAWGWGLAIVAAIGYAATRLTEQARTAACRPCRAPRRGGRRPHDPFSERSCSAALQC